MEYPKNHRLFVEALMNGRFILTGEKHFDELKDHQEFYVVFFQKSFGHQLIVTQEYAYLVSDETDENLSRDISILFAILCYELDKLGKNFLAELQYSEYSFDDVNSIFENSSYLELIQSNRQLKDVDARRRLILTTMNKRRIIEKVNDDKFYFTAAHKVFIDFAREFGETKQSLD